MRTEDIRNMAKAYAAVLEKLKSEDKLDPVDHKELKGKHKDRKDKDIDNDGDVDSTDKYLHKRRKAVSKSIKKDNGNDTDVQTQETTEAKVECPKCEGKGCDHCDDKGYHIKEKTEVDEISIPLAKKVLKKRADNLQRSADKYNKEPGHQGPTYGNKDLEKKRMAKHSALRKYSDDERKFNRSSDMLGKKTGGRTGKAAADKRFDATPGGKKYNANNESYIGEASKGTAQHKPDEKTRDTWEKQLSTRKGEKDFKDQHKVETPEAGDEPKIDALNFQKFKSMVAKKDNSRSADQKKGDNNIIPSATPVKGA
jgi:hypothetical protein